MSVTVANDSGVAIDLDDVQRLGEFLLQQLRIHPESELSVVFCDEPAMTELHVRWMDEPGPTDVLSFPMDELRVPEPGAVAAPGVLGDVVICPQVAQVQAVAAGHRPEDELDLLLTHGVLHLLGHDHLETDDHAEMFGLQAQLLDAWVAERSGVDR